MLLGILLLGLSMSQNCPKVTKRKEANDVTESEWKMIVDTIKLAQKTAEKGDPDGYSIWEAGADTHLDASNPDSKKRVHNSCMFFGWHRVFLVEMEKKLQALNKDFFFPYWDSPKQWGNADNAPVWKYLGGKGSPVTNDIFGGARFKLKGFEKPLGRTSGILNENLVASETYDDLLAKNIKAKASAGYGGWSQEVELQHGTVHVTIGGDNGQMSAMASPLDPLFYLHHAHLDYLWLQAQVQWTEMKFDQYGGIKPDGSKCTKTDIVPGYNITLEQAVELKNLCVEYAQPTVLAIPDVSEIPATVTISTKKSAGTAAPKSVAKTMTGKGKSKETNVSGATKRAATTTREGKHKTSKYGATAKNAKTKSAQPTEAAYTNANNSSQTTVVKNRRRTRNPKSKKRIFVHPSNAPKIERKSPPYKTPESDVGHLCPKPVSDRWLKMLGGDYDKLRKKRDELDKACQKMVEEIKRGKYIKPVPEVIESVRKPCAPVAHSPIIPKSKKISKGSKSTKSKGKKGNSKSKGKKGKSKSGKGKSSKQNGKAKGVQEYGKGNAEAEEMNGTALITPFLGLVVMVLVLLL